MSKKTMLDQQKRKEMVKHIQAFFRKERDEELGELAALMVLDFIEEELGPEFYNQGIEDAYKYINDRAEEMLALQKY